MDDWDSGEAYDPAATFHEQESALLSIVRQLHAGAITWADARERLIDFPYANPTPYAGSPLPSAGKAYADWYNDVEDRIGLAPEPNTWAQLIEAQDYRLISAEQVLEVTEGKMARAQSRAESKAQSPEGHSRT